jgi:hypothetical protein
MSIRCGDWFVTFTGKRFYPLDPRIEDIEIRDIAHSLSLQARWMGHSQTHYSVASHSLACACVAERDYPGVTDISAWCLMHDAAEAYVGDVIRPIKRYLYRVARSHEVNWGKQFLEEPDVGGYSRIEGFVQTFGGVEDRILRLIAEKYKFPWPIPEVVHTIDNRMLVTEALALTRYVSDRHWIYEKPWADTKPYADHVLIHQSMEAAEKAFLGIAKEYFPAVS